MVEAVSYTGNRTADVQSMETVYDYPVTQSTYLYSSTQEKGDWLVTTIKYDERKNPYYTLEVLKITLSLNELSWLKISDH